MADAVRSGTLLGTALATLVVAIASAVSSTALAGAGNPVRQNLVDSTVRFLQESQRPSGGFANPGKKPSQSISAWVALALAAAGVNPQDQATCGVDAYTFLESHFAASFQEEIAWPQVATTAFERELLVVDAAGTDPHDFAGYDLVAEIVDRQRPDGSLPYVPGGEGQVNDAVFAIVALAPIAEPKAREAIEKASDWLLTEQNPDGGWNWQNKGRESEVDLTGAAIEALNAAGRHGTEAQERAIAFLHRSQRPDGGFTEYPGKEIESNVASTAWGVQGLWAAGENPETWRTGSGQASEEPLDYMESLQQPDGHIRWKKSSDLNGIWMTAYVAPAFAGQALPIPTAPRSLPAAASSTLAAAADLPASCSETVAGGGTVAPGAEAPKSSEGVISAGGGEGAPDFSRPKPQSRGKTPGGARIVHRKSTAAVNHSPTRRGENTVQPAGIETSEADPEGEEPDVVGSGAGSGTGGGSGSGGGAWGREVTGTLVGSLNAKGGDKLAFGAPGLRSAGGGSEETWIAVALGVGALLFALGGCQWERRRQEVLS